LFSRILLAIALLHFREEMIEHVEGPLRLAEDHDRTVIIEDGEVQLERYVREFEEYSPAWVPKLVDRFDIRCDLGQVLGVVSTPSLLARKEPPPAAWERAIEGVETGTAGEGKDFMLHTDEEEPQIVLGDCV
jgi:hypothetical protein